VISILAVFFLVSFQASIVVHKSDFKSGVWMWWRFGHMARWVGGCDLNFWPKWQRQEGWVRVGLSKIDFVTWHSLWKLPYSTIFWGNPGSSPRVCWNDEFLDLSKIRSHHGVRPEAVLNIFHSNGRFIFPNRHVYPFDVCARKSPARSEKPPCPCSSAARVLANWLNWPTRVCVRVCVCVLSPCPCSSAARTLVKRTAHAVESHDDCA